MSYNLGVVMTNLAPYTAQVRPDMIVVHGDRIDALAGAITGALNNILVAHIEGEKYREPLTIPSAMLSLNLPICILCVMKRQKRGSFSWEKVKNISL